MTRGIQSPTTRRNLSHAIIAELTRRIRDQELAVGDRLPTEKGLMDEFGVGRNTAREAIQGLVAKGLITTRPGAGARVIAPDARATGDAITLAALVDGDTAADLYQFRMLLEVENAALAAKHADRGQLAAIQRALRNFDDAVDMQVPTWEEDIAFHQAIANASGNPIFGRVLEAVSDLLSAARRATDDVPGASELAREQHREIFVAIKDGDASAARSHMRKHIDAARDAMTKAQSAK